MNTKPFPYADLVAFLQRQLGVCEELNSVSRANIYKIAKHLAGNLAQIAEVRYKSL